MGTATWAEFLIANELLVVVAEVVNEGYRCVKLK
jgi:hypothetical protein